MSMETHPTDLKLSWEDDTSYLLLNPVFSNEEKNRFQSILEEGASWKRHIWLSTSGSTVEKWVGLSKQAMLASAQSINRHLDCNDRDAWINPLPFFHVGGLGIYARAFLSGSQVFPFHKKWDPSAFYRFCEETKGTLTSLVPTQLHDLVKLNKHSPRLLRAVVIGGGALHPDLYAQARQLGWPILPSYGLTECASQVATASLDSLFINQYPQLKVLSHCQVKEMEEHLCFYGPSLLTTYAIFKEGKVRFADPKKEGWFVSEDRGRVDNDELFILGRIGSMIKIGGENVDLASLENHLKKIELKHSYQGEIVLMAVKDERLGNKLIAVVEKEDSHDPVIAEYQATVLPFERIRDIFYVKNFPRSPLGKIQKGKLMEEINRPALLREL